MSYMNSLISRANEMDFSGDDGQGSSDLPALRFASLKVDDYKIGDNVFKFFLMPYVQEDTGKEELFQLYYKHYSMPVGFENGSQVKISRVCIDKQGGLECPFCEVLKAELGVTNNTEKRKTIQRMEATVTAYVNALPLQLAGKKVNYDEVPYLPHILGMKEKGYHWILKFVQENDLANNLDLDPFNPHNALPFAINVARHGKRKQDIRYSYQFDMKRGKFSGTDEGLVNLYENIYDLTRIFKMPKDEDLGAYGQEAKAVAAMLESMRKSSVGLFSAVPKASPAVPSAPAPQTPAAAPTSVPKAPAQRPSTIPSRPNPSAPAAAPAAAPATTDEELF